MLICSFFCEIAYLDFVVTERVTKCCSKRFDVNFFLCLKKYIFTCLALWGLSCSMWDPSANPHPLHYKADS